MSALAAIRPGTDADSAGAIALLARCFADYPGCILDVEREEPGMLVPASHFAGRGGRFWVADVDGAVAGMAAAVPSDGGRWQVCKVYVHPDHHGAGLGHRLLDTVEAHALQAGATGLHLWTDTRFDRAHRFYEKRGYVRAGPIRALGDISNSLEFHYAKPVDGVMVLDAAGAASAVRGLAGVLATDKGPPEDAPLTVHDHARAVAQGRGLLLAGWRGGAMAGLAMVGFHPPPHRAELARLVVHPGCRRLGLGMALLQAAEAAAADAGRGLLVAHVPADGAAERMLLAAGWTAAGRIPGWHGDGPPSAATALFKQAGPAAPPTP